MFAKWGFHLSQIEIAQVVKHFMEEHCVVEKGFRNNVPSIAWVQDFIQKDNKFTERHLSVPRTC